MSYQITRDAILTIGVTDLAALLLMLATGWLK